MGWACTGALKAKESKRGKNAEVRVFIVEG